VIDDGTGTLEVKQWVDADNSTENGSFQGLNGQYVRVLGQLKTFSNKKHVGSHKIRLVADYNEVQYHLLEAAAIHLHLTRGPPEQFAPASDGGATWHDGQARAGGGDTVMGGMGGGPGAGLEGLSRAARTIYEAIKANSDPDVGVHINTIRNKAGLSEEAFKTALEELSDGGQAFTTVDNCHFAVLL